MVETEEGLQPQSDDAVCLKGIIGEKNLAQLGGKDPIALFVDELIPHPLIDKIGVQFGDVEIRVIQLYHLHQKGGFLMFVDICFQFGCVFEFHKDLR
jgi:hypothetical protein